MGHFKLSAVHGLSSCSCLETVSSLSPCVLQLLPGGCALLFVVLQAHDALEDRVLAAFTYLFPAAVLTGCYCQIVSCV
jgi:hypothetical protein